LYEEEKTKMKIHHFAYEVSDMDASMRFYTQKLGFKIQMDKVVDEHQHEAFAILESDGGRLELVQALSDANEPQPFQPVSIRPHACPHLALQVEDFDRALATLAAEGLPLLHGPFEVPNVVKWLYFCDPDGNVIEFIQDLADG
jgi:catechol 2,3-dioxygenase-like lactoylglutathione lyase family enzyme